jgi:NADPH-dependent 2,4-dienoyl-CoA reductase/sulfur reductase-like enzyme
LDQIRPCIYCCQGCIQNVLEHDAPVACSVNPEAGNAGLAGPAPGRSKKVVVLGAGPGGLQAAVTAAAQQHDVYLFEKSDRLGGDLNLAARLDSKKPIRRYLDYLIRQVQRSTIHLRLNEDADLETIERLTPDVVIVATGSRPVKLDIPGCTPLNSATADEILAGRKVDGRKVVVIGGGPTGCEVAEFLAEAGKEVAIVEVLGDVATQMDRINRVALLNALERLKVSIYTKSQAKSLKEGCLQIESLGRTIAVEADFVVLAAGKQPVSEGVDLDLKRQSAAQVHIIGDKAKTRGIMAAVQEGYQTAMKI